MGRRWSVCEGRILSRVAAIDCGTNSIRLLIAEVTDDGLHDLTRRMEIVRLGQGVDRTGRFADDALQRTFAALEAYAAAIAGAQVERIRMVATSAPRDAANWDVFIDGVRQRLVVEPDVVSGDEEAQLSFAGATAELFRGGSHWPAPYLVCDIGGGATEVVVGGPDGGQAAA